MTFSQLAAALIVGMTLSTIYLAVDIVPGLRHVVVGALIGSISIYVGMKVE